MAMVALVATSGVMGQRAYVEDGNENPDSEQARLAMNRAQGGLGNINPERTAVKSKKAPLLETFRGTSKKVSGDGVWQERGTATLWYDGEGKLLNIEVANNDGTSLEEKFNQMCEDGAMYSLQMPDFDLLTSQSACTYKDRGPNETLTFFTDDKGVNLIGFNYDVSTASIFPLISLFVSLVH